MKKFFIYPLLLLIAITLIFYFSLIYLNIGKNETNLETTIIYYILGVFFSLLLIIIAYTKLGEANKQSRINYLIRIDERWASTEIVEAREVIHLLYLDAREMEPKYKSREEMRLIIGKGIMDMHSNREKIPEFIRLLNFLDFLETIGYDLAPKNRTPH
ncbi:TPA: hypothetical protein I8Y75_002615 [Legionella pneumophila]|nr:hypothetical protein [Legionella pneumophila]